MPVSQSTNTLPAQIAPFENLEEEAVVGPLDPVVDEHAVHLADVVPDAVGAVAVVDHEIVAARHAVALVEDLHRGGVVAGDVFDVVPRDDVPLQQHVVRAEDVDAFGARVAHQAVANRQLVAAEVAGHARTERNRAILERRCRRRPCRAPTPATRPRDRCLRSRGPGRRTA